MSHKLDFLSHNSDFLPHNDHVSCPNYLIYQTMIFNVLEMGFYNNVPMLWLPVIIGVSFMNKSMFVNKSFEWRNHCISIDSVHLLFAFVSAQCLNKARYYINRMSVTLS